jgi:hypothetical protein
MFVVRPAPRAELLKRHPLRIVPLVLGRCVVRRLACRALKPEGNPVFPLRHVVNPLPRRSADPQCNATAEKRRQDTKGAACDPLMVHLTTSSGSQLRETTPLGC